MRILIQNSQVFRDLLVACAATNAQKVIEFTDTHIEQASVIRSALAFLSRAHEDTSPVTLINVKRAGLLYEFANKWDCSVLESAMLASLFRMTNDPKYYSQGRVHVEIFTIAAHRDQLLLCTNLFRPNVLWSAGSAVAYGFKEGYYALDPKSWPICFIKRVPVAYLWTLSTVMQPYGPHMSPTGEEMRKLPQAFQSLMEEWNTSSSVSLILLDLVHLFIVRVSEPGLKVSILGRNVRW
jgi:hypothetical protein